ncbi:MAG: TetR/AcrR family transcriptional regulator C-terminal domain-containing protein [Deltaproteobacteria bacterium]|nr:TetR/AcrR family transcriptional regulator C-terminal domain-containing protein [Deltaproteobacteria bacterium]
MPRLSRDRVVDAALRLVDEQGPSALSMRKVGAALGVEGMALYRWVGSKDGLLDAVFERLLTDLEVAPSSGHPLADCATFARALRASLTAHPHWLPLIAGRPAITSASLAVLEEALERVGALGLTGREALVAVQTLYVFVLGHCQFHAAPAPESMEDLDYAQLSAEDFPRLSAIDPASAEEEFEGGLALWLRGLAS